MLYAARVSTVVSGPIYYCSLLRIVRSEKAVKI